MYFFYYLILAVPALFFLLRGDWPAFRRFSRNVVCTFCVCFLVFVLYPVAGPYYVFERPTGLMVDNLPAHMVYAALASGSSFGAAFPSSHVAATTAAGLATFKGNRTLGMDPAGTGAADADRDGLHPDALRVGRDRRGFSSGLWCRGWRRGWKELRERELKRVNGERGSRPFTAHR